MQKNNEVILSHGNIILNYISGPNGLAQVGFNPGTASNTNGRVHFPNFQVAVAGKPFGQFSPSLVTGYSNLPLEMKMEKFEDEQERIRFNYKHEILGLRVIVDMQLIKGSDMIRQTTTAINEGNTLITLNHLSSVCMQGIAIDGLRPWYDPEKIKVHYCMQTWEGEGQWRSGNLEELGVYPTSIHQCTASVHFSSMGSYSTSKYLPMMIIEDLETGKVWYLQIETSSNWHIELGYRGSWDDKIQGSLFFHADGSNEINGSWVKHLQPGESFTSVPVGVGCCYGGFYEAIKELTKYRRQLLKHRNTMYPGYSPVIFNDYMNCLWGNPTVDALIPLIDRASEFGAEYFCIDAGWFAEIGETWSLRLGDWKPAKERFGEIGFKGMLDYIYKKGLKPGIWLEMEVCGENSSLGKKPDKWFLMRNGKRVGGGDRWFLNYSNSGVRNYMHEIIDNLVDMGVRYIKNDYNACVGNGDDRLGSSAADGLIINTLAFYSFIDEVKEKYPDLILENCASGAMRSDYGILSHFDLQSFSDQEIYFKCPSIIGGSLAGILPEQLGIWSYPYPLDFYNRSNWNTLENEMYLKRMEDGEQTIFNMINGMCGVMFLSGHIDCADSLNAKLIKEGISVYKRIRSHVQNSYPLWPLGFTRINAINNWSSVGFISDDSSKMLLAVWRLEGNEDYQELNLKKWIGNNVLIKQIYPERNFGVNYHYNEFKGSLTLCMPKKFQARLFEIKSIDMC